MPDALEGAITAIDHVQLTIPEGDEHLAEARRCYVDVLGMTEVEKPAPLQSRGGAWFEAGPPEARFQVHLGVEAPLETRRHPAFVTPDLDALRARCEAAGYRTEDDVPLVGRRRFHLWDPFGNRIELLQWTEAPFEV